MTPACSDVPGAHDPESFDAATPGPASLIPGSVRLAADIAVSAITGNFAEMKMLRVESSPFQASATRSVPGSLWAFWTLRTQRLLACGRRAQVEFVLVADSAVSGSSMSWMRSARSAVRVCFLPSGPR